MLRASVASSSITRTAQGKSVSLRGRKQHVDDGSRARGALERDRAAEALHDAPRERQADADALRLAGVEGLERALDFLRRHARAAVAHAHAQAVLAVALDRDANGAVALDSLHRVGDQ